jgi:hypothetical protein
MTRSSTSPGIDSATGQWGVVRVGDDRVAILAIAIVDQPSS